MIVKFTGFVTRNLDDVAEEHFPYIHLNVHADEGTIEVDVEADFQPEEPDVLNLPNGDPGHPGCAASADITQVTWRGADVLLFLSKAEVDQLQEEAVEAGAEQLQDEEEQRC